MDKNILKLVIPLFLILIFLIGIVSLLSSLQKPSGISPSPTLIPTSYQDTPFITLTPTLIPPTFTGGSTEKLPQTVVDLAAEKQNLRSKLPIDEASFSISFDYGTDMFIVSLNDPKDTNQTVFDQWLKTNYPNLPFDRFEIK